MSSSLLGNILLDKEILLESGTNELEVLVFDVANYVFGINVAKVREVLPKAAITHLPKAHHSIRGVFKLRNNVIPCVSLVEHLGLTATAGEETESTMILADFNKQQTAFLVDSVERIHRLSWKSILPVPGLSALSKTPVTALARCENRLILMLDFEMIIDDVTSHYFRTDAVENPLGLPREKLKIIFAEDSPTVREAIGVTLSKSGYTQVSFFENGALAWQAIEERLKVSSRAEDVCDLVIADVEMPQMDGFHLTKQIKTNPVLKQTPVLLYSSIITPDNHKKGEAVGADAQVAKPDLCKVVQLADDLIANARREVRAETFRTVVNSVNAAEEAKGQSPAAVAKPKTSPAVPAQKPVAVQTPAPKADASASAAASNSASKPAVQAPATQQKTAAAQTVPASPSVTSSPAASNGLAPARIVLDEFIPPPGVDKKLWRTFMQELSDRFGALKGQAYRMVHGGNQEEIILEMARTLHTIKSASMVVPFDPVTRCTHLVESVLEAVSKAEYDWPQAQIDSYIKWLERLSSPDSDLEDVLTLGFQIETELQAVVGVEA